MKIDLKDIKKILNPNPDFEVVEKTFVDVGNLGELKNNYLYEPKNFILAGDYGSGKGDQFSWLYNDAPFMMRKFDLPATKKLIENRLRFYKLGYRTNNIISDEKLQEVILESNNNPRSILIKIRDNILRKQGKIPL